MDVVELRRAGDLHFSNLVWTHEEPADSDLATGRVHIDAYDLRIKQQTVSVYRAIERKLGEFGLEASHVAHQRVHLSDFRDLGRWREIMVRIFPNWKAATVVIGEGVALPPGSEIAVEVIASARADVKAEPLWVDKAASATDPFPSGARCGQFFFTSAINPTTREGETVMTLADLQAFGQQRPDIPDFFGFGLYGRRDELYAAQMLAIYENMRCILEKAGTGLDQLVRQNGWVSMHMRSFTAFEAARRFLFGQRLLVPPTATVQVGDVGNDAHVAINFEAIAVFPGLVERVVIPTGDVMSPYGHYAPLLRVGSLVFVAGDLAFSSQFGGVVGAWENDPGRALIGQARFVARRIRLLLDRAGVPPEGIRRFGLFLRDPSLREAWERLTMAELPGADPAIGYTTVKDCGPYESCLFELEAVGAINGS